jgi:Periplasmic binding protein-like domain
MTRSSVPVISASIRKGVNAGRGGQDGLVRAPSGEPGLRTGGEVRPWMPDGARGVLDTARDLGRVVPDDIAVIGFDNWEVLTTNARPQLTSIDANLQQLGRTAAQRVFAAIDGVDIGAGTHYLPVRLVIRGSTVARR